VSQHTDLPQQAQPQVRRTELPGAVDDRLFFAQVREDPKLEIAAFAGRWNGPIAVVSSAGCTALSLLAAGAAEVVGVDVNRTQNHLVELKAAAIAGLEPGSALGLLGGAPMTAALRRQAYGQVRDALTPGARGHWDAHPQAIDAGVLQAGVTERLMRLIARSLRVIHPSHRIDTLLSLRTLDEQREFYRREWDTAGWRLLFQALCNRLVLRRTYDERFFAHVEDPSYARHFRQVAEHTLTDLDISGNYFLHHLLTGRYPANCLPPYLSAKVPVDGLSLVDGAFTDYLRARPDASMAGFALSNICEWLTPDQIDELFAEIVRTARPGARLVFRNFVGWTEVPPRWRDAIREDRARGEQLMRTDRSLCQRRFALCEVAA
jgi:S-adenosylmethionine-diacylglycerol 3-amino-3-carboxypropyl transferase